MMNISSTGPAARATAHSAEQRERQHDELDPARDHDRRDLRRRLRRRRGRAARRARPRPLLGRRLVRLRARPLRCRVRRLACPSVCAPGRLEPSARVRCSRGGHPLRRRHRRLRRPPHAQGAAARAARGARARLRRRQRRERGGRHRDHAQARRRALRRGRRRDHARQPHLPPPRGLALPRRAAQHPAARELPALPARPRHVRVRARRRRHARRRQPVGQPLHAGGAPGLHRRSTTRCARSPAPTTCSSTCTPRRRARRSRWAGSSTAA